MGYFIRTIIYVCFEELTLWSPAQQRQCDAEFQKGSETRTDLEMHTKGSLVSPALGTI
jgi:hypothetical protein